MRRLKTFEGFHLDETTQVVTHLCEEMEVNITSSEEIEGATIYTIERSDKSDLEVAVILEEHIQMLGEVEPGKSIALSIQTDSPRVIVYEGNLGDVIFAHLDSMLGDMEVESSKNRWGEDTVVYTKDGHWYFWHFKDDSELKISYQIENVFKDAIFGLSNTVMMPKGDLDRFNRYNGGDYVSKGSKLTANTYTGYVKMMSLCHDWFSSRFEKFDYVDFV
jgi:hypothetical protein